MGQPTVYKDGRPCNKGGRSDDKGCHLIIRVIDRGNAHLHHRMHKSSFNGIKKFGQSWTIGPNKLKKFRKFMFLFIFKKNVNVILWCSMWCLQIQQHFSSITFSLKESNVLILLNDTCHNCTET